ncbi:MAG: sugar transferase [Clostridiaceae bacterium]|nr:sugar transferase [Clostridiaceae bacterium]
MLVKRIFDIFFSFIGIIILLPFSLIIAFLVYVKLGRPILFKQERVGKNDKIFKMFKFRTMLNTKDRKGNLISDEKRLTGFGKALRDTSLDELPELINVLKGDMSLVGPRPLLVSYLPIYTRRQRKRHDVLPGITGWAQVNGRNAISWRKKFKLDLWYIEHWSFWLDLQIIFITIRKVFRKENINQKDNVTVEAFNGFN